jgi:polyhydroxybutyrate depolymerase
MSIGRPRSVRGWLTWAALIVLVLLVLGAARRNRDEAPATTEATPTVDVSGTPAGGIATAVSTPTAPSVQPADRPLPGESRASLEVSGRTREWRLYVPRSLAQIGDVPLVVGLHGGLGSGEQFAADGFFDSQAERGAFIAVYPDGISRGRLLDARTWNAGGCCGTAMNEGVDDVAFIAALVDRLASELPIDRDRVYATGHSNGAMMAQRLACDRADLFAAIAVYSGPLQTPCAPSEPISVLNIHGDADENILIGGGNGPRAVSNTDYTSLAETAATWVSLNGCTTALPANIEGAVTTSIWTDCRDGVVVETQIVAGANHAWAGGAPTGRLRADPSPDLDASSAIWDFLSDKAR